LDKKRQEKVPEGAEPGRVFSGYAKYLNIRRLAMMEKGSRLLRWQGKCHIITGMDSWELSLRRRMNEKKFTRFFAD
jgi:hypothetical protein